ncbi:MAG: dynamin family protein [Synergistaceae bacterium]|nr:dynamin family protein [Synergistaceae bacterium]
MQSLSEWERYKFSGTSSAPDLTVIFPSREMYFSSALMSVMHFTSQTCPRTLDQWYELCSPEDHAKISLFERALSSSEQTITLTRKLYCGDGVYRSFRLDAQITRDSRSRPVMLTGTETPSLVAWLGEASDGDRIECTSSCGSVRILEAVSVDGVKVLQDVSSLEDMMRENITLRRELQRRVFGTAGQIPHAELTERDAYLREVLDDTLRLSMNVLTGNSTLKGLRRSLNEDCLTAGICGLSGSGKTSLMNALIGEKLLPLHSRNSVPVTCREGESRGAKIHYQDGRTESLSSKGLTASSLEGLLGKSGVSRIDLTIPGALIPSGICFVDTPGYDALGGTNTSILRKILPELDAVLYVTPIRSGLKMSDYDYLKSIYAMNDRVIFLLAWSDLESEDSEAGRVLRTAEAKIAENMDLLRQDIRTLTEKESVIIPVSSRYALEHFCDRKSPEWSGSNIEAVADCLADEESSPFTRAIIFRAERTLKLLDAALENRALTGSSRWRLQDYAGTLRKALADSPKSQGSPKVAAIIHTLSASQETDKNLLSSLITSLREHDFRSRFFSLKAFHGERNAMLLGADRTQSLRLYSRLAHNLLSEKLPEGHVSRNEWLSSGNAAMFECIRLPVISPGENVLIAPCDADLKAADWQEIFRHFTPVVSVDLSRIVSGLNDLSRAPYLMGLAMSDWVLAFGNGGLFAQRQTELLSAVPERVKEFAESGGLRVPELFIYENYRIF